MRLAPLGERCRRLHHAGDGRYGFEDGDLALLAGLPALADTGFPLLVGLSRKSLIGKVLGLPVDKRLIPGILIVSESLISVDSAYYS